MAGNKAERETERHAEPLAERRAHEGSPLRLLVVDAYPEQGRNNLAGAGGTEGGTLYRRMLERMAPDAEIEVVHPADATAEYANAESFAAGYDGAVWTGSNLSILDRGTPAVERLVEFAVALLASGVPSFGSCFAVQLAAVATGGRCTANPRGREFGVAREIRLTEAGAAHPLYRGKATVFDAFTSHADEVAVLGSNAELLATNGWSRVQAAALEGDTGSFWAVQYHPEYDCHEVASLCRLRRQELVAQGTFATKALADRHIEMLEKLHTEPNDAEVATSLGIGAALLDTEARTREVRNWLDARVLGECAMSPEGNSQNP